MIERELIEEIRISNDIVALVSSYVSLKRSGSTFQGLCPFHKEKTPSFHVIPDKQIYHCFGCGASGNSITFMMQIENYNFLDALKQLADRANIVIEERSSSKDAKLLAQNKKILYEINKKAARFFYDSMKNDSEKRADLYLQERQLSLKTQIKCGLGYSPKGSALYSYLKMAGYDDDIIVLSGLAVKQKGGNGYYDRFFERLMFPIFDVSGRVVGFGGRVLGDGMPKYLNSPETPVFEKGRLLYGLNFARNSKRREILLVEGYMDAISLYQAGFENAVASLGTAFTKYHAKLIKNYADSVIILYDADSAGTKAIYKAFPLLVDVGLSVKIVQTTDAKDPDAYLKQFGIKKFTELLNSAQNHIAWQIDNERKKYNLDDNVDEKVAFTREVAKILGKVGSKIEQDAYIKETAKITNISENAIRSEVVADSGDTYENRVIIPRRVTAANVPRNIIEAQKRLLSIIAAKQSVLREISKYIQTDDFTNETYRKLYELMSSLSAEGKMPNAAEFASYFETVDEQRYVTEALMFPALSLSRKEVEKELTDQLKTLKLYNLTKKSDNIAEENDENALKIVINELKTVKTLNISLIDG